MEDVSTGIAERVQRILNETGWSQRRLAREAKLPSESHIGLIVSGLGGTKVQTLQAIARASGYSFTWIATGEGPPRPQHDADAIPQTLAEVLSQEPPRGRRGVWLPVTVEQLARSWSYGGVERSQEEWARLGDDYDYVNRRHGLQVKRIERGVGDALEDEIEAKRAANRAKRGG